MKRATSRDVALRAGVSQATVSNLLTGAHTVAPETRARIEAAMTELAYRPNGAARAMRLQRNSRLAVVLPGIAAPTRLLAGAMAAAQEAGFALEVHGLAGSPEQRAERLAELADSGQVDGILALAPVGLPDQDGTDETSVIFTLEAYDGDLHQRADVTDGAPIAELVDGLAAMGHTRFLHVAGDATYASAQARRAAFEQAVAKTGVESLGVVDGDWSFASGLAAARGLNEADLPLAVIAANDRVALGVLRGVQERGWSVPGQVSVTGWDDADFGEYVWPALTTVRIDEEGLGRRAVERLVALVRGAAEPAETRVRLDQQVMWRGSTGAPAARTPA